ncbi:MAG: M23 family metallopeptidase [Patescibacteria group bacterium]
MKFPKTTISLLAGLFRLFGRLLRTFSFRKKFIKKITKAVAKFFFNLAIFPLYKGYYKVKYQLLTIYAPAKSKLFYLLNKRYLIHIVVSLLGIFVIYNNLYAQGLRDDNFGDRTIVYTILAEGEFERLTEETQVFAANQILSYLDKSFTVDSNNNLPNNEKQELATDYYSLAEGGSAIVKPHLIKPIDVPVSVEDQIDMAPRQGIMQYVVGQGETLSAIAKKFNISVETILWQNGLTARSIIRPGDELEILPMTGVMHKVKRGETLGAISRKYAVAQDKIVSANNMYDSASLKIGQQLIIPDGRMVVVGTTPKNVATKNTPQVAPITKLFLPPEKVANGDGYIWPAGVRRISQYFSWRHTGLDIAGPTGTNIYAVESGTVVFSGVSNGYGNNIMIDHGNGLKTRYAHASKLYVEKGDSVVKGQTIMAMGSTGWSTGPHLHFEVIVNGAKKNPLAYIK